MSQRYRVTIEGDVEVDKHGPGWWVRTPQVGQRVTCSKGAWWLSGATIVACEPVLSPLERAERAEAVLRGLIDPDNIHWTTEEIRQQARDGGVTL